MSVELEIEERNRLIGENLRKYRLLKGLTQEELASGLCSVSQLSKVENGKTHLNRSILKQMAGRLGVTVERIEMADAMLEELGEQLQLAKDAMQAKQFTRALEVIEEVLARAREFEYKDITATATLYFAKVLVRLQRQDEAIEIIKDALEDPSGLDSMLIVLYYCQLGHAYRKNGNFIMAIDAFCRADEENIDVSVDKEFLVEMYFSLAQSHFEMNNNRAALRYYEKSEEFATAYSKHLFRIRSSYMKASSLKRLGEIEKAEAIFLKTLKEAEDNGFLLDIAIINNNLGNLFDSVKEYSQAKAHYKRAIQVFELLGEEIYLCSPLLHLAEIALWEEDYQLTGSLIERVLELIDRNPINSYKEKATAYRILGKVCHAKGHFDEHIDYLETALALYDQHSVFDEAYTLAKQIAESLYQKNDLRAIEMYRKTVEYNEQLIAIVKRR